MTDINSLPYEIMEKIFLNTEGKTLIKSRTVCKTWKDLIDDNDYIWREKCRDEFKFSSLIAKRKCGNELKWCQIYKNLTMWSKFSQCERNLRKFYNFSMHDKNHSLDVDYSILPLNEANGMTLYDMTTLKYIPVAIPEKNCFKISSNDTTTVILVKSSILIQRNADNKGCMSELVLRADNFVLTKHELYYFNNRDVFKMDLKHDNLEPELLLHSQFDIKEIQFCYNMLYIFTDCGKIISVDQENTIATKPITCPDQWVKWIKNVTLLDDKNYICYSRHLFQIETNNYRHLYLDFPNVTAVFFYGEIILLGTKAGEILLYRMSSQKPRKTAVFEKIAILPEQKFAVKLDVYERKTGPLIVATTFLELFLLDVMFFPEEEDTKPQKRPLNSATKISLYKRLLKLKDRLKDK